MCMLKSIEKEPILFVGDPLVMEEAAVDRFRNNVYITNEIIKKSSNYQYVAKHVNLIFQKCYNKKIPYI